MSGLGDALFGTPGTPAEVIDVTPPEFVGLRAPVAGSLTGIIESGGGPTFQGPQTAALGAEEQARLDAIARSARDESGTGRAVTDFLREQLSGAGLSPESNPFLKAQIEAAQRGEIENFERITDPRLRQGFTIAGQSTQPGGSSPFDRALAISTKGVLDRLSDISTNISGQNFQLERERQSRVPEQISQITSAELQRQVTSLQAAALPRLIEQLGIDRGREEFERRIEVLLQALGLAGSLGKPATEVLPGTPGTKGALGEIAGALIPAAATFFGGPVAGAAVAGATR